LVRDGDIDRLLDVLAAAATIWGGMRCPILPVKEDGTIDAAWLRIAQLLQVVQIVDFTQDSGGVSKWSDCRMSQWPVVPARPITDGNFWHAHPMVSHSPTELQNTTFFLPEERNLLSMASIGDLVLEDELSWWERSGVGLLKRTSEQAWVRPQISQRTVLQATAHHDTETVTVSPFMKSLALIWLVNDLNDFNETVWFWNHRALRPRGFPEGVSVYVRPQTLADEEVSSALLEKIRQTASTRPDIALVSFSVSKEDACEVAEQIGLHLYEGKKYTERIGDAQLDLSRDLSFEFNPNVTQFWMVNRAIGLQHEAPLMLQRPNSQLRTTSPVQWNPELVGGGHIALRISGPDITGPQRSNVAELYLPNGVWEGGRVRIIAHPLPEYNLTVGTPDASSILTAACSDAGATFELNDKGQQVRGILKVGIDPNLFRRADMLAVITALTPEPDRDLIRQLRAMVAAGQVTEAQLQTLMDLSAANRSTIRSLNDIKSSGECTGMAWQPIASVLETLVANGLALRGWRVDCATCTLRDFREIHATQAAAVCIGCGSPARYAAGARGEPELFYRLNTLLQRVSLNGGLAVLAATAVLLDEGGYVVPGVNIADRTSAALGDLDILGWQKTTLFAGESKMTARGFENQDHQRDVSKSRAIGADVHLTICLDPLPSDIRESIKSECTEAGIECRLLDRLQLVV